MAGAPAPAGQLERLGVSERPWHSQVLPRPVLPAEVQDEPLSVAVAAARAMPTQVDDRASMSAPRSTNDVVASGMRAPTQNTVAGTQRGRAHECERQQAHR